MRFVMIKKIKFALPLVFIQAVILCWFSPWWACNRVLAPMDLQNCMMSPWRAQSENEFAKNHIVSDGVDQYLVYRLIAERNYHEEGWVGWSSLTYGGTEQYANTMALYYDWTMQLHRWFDFWNAWHLGLLGQVSVAAIGMFLFLRGRGINNLWASCGSLAYAANSQFITWIYHRWALGAFSWVPLILWSMDLYRRDKKYVWALPPLFIAMALLGGTLQHAVFVMLVVVALWIEELFHARKHIKNCHKEMQVFKWRKYMSLHGRYLVWILLGVGLAAMMVIPCTDAFISSSRLGIHAGMHGNVENGIYPHGWTQPIYNLLSYPLQAFPSILGRCGSVDVLKMFKSELFYVAYFGTLPVVISFVSLWRFKVPIFARALILLGLMIPLTPLVRVLYQRTFLLFIIGGIFAFVHVMQFSSKKNKILIFKFLSKTSLVLITLWFILSCVLVAKPELLSHVRDKIVASGQGSSFGYFQEWIANRADNFTGDLFLWSEQQIFPLLLFVVSLIGLGLSGTSNKNWSRFGSAIVSFVVLAEVTLFGSRWVVWSDIDKYPLFPETPELAFLKKQVDRDCRVTTVVHPTAHMALTPFIPNTLAAYDVATISGYDSIVPDGMVLPNALSGDAVRMGRFAVSHLITWHGNVNISPMWSLIWQSPAMDLYLNNECIPRYIGFSTDNEKEHFFSGLTPKFVELREISGLENSRNLILPSGISWVRIAENYAKGWQYKIKNDTTWRTVSRGDDASILVENPVPNESVQIEMRYFPPLRKVGFLISFFSMLVILLVQIFMSWGFLLSIVNCMRLRNCRNYR
jgi:hypothetical protein